MTYTFSSSSAAVCCGGPWHSIQSSSIPRGLWILFACFLFPLYLHSLHSRSSIFTWSSSIPCSLQILLSQFGLAFVGFTFFQHDHTILSGGTSYVLQYLPLVLLRLFISLFVLILQFSPYFTGVYIFTILLSNILSAFHSSLSNSYLCYPCAFTSCIGTTLALAGALTWVLVTSFCRLHVSRGFLTKILHALLVFLHLNESQSSCDALNH